MPLKCLSLNCPKRLACLLPQSWGIGMLSLYLLNRLEHNEYGQRLERAIILNYQQGK
jgi:hypothetical protein